MGFRISKKNFGSVFDTDFTLFLMVFGVHFTICVPFGCRSFFVRLPLETSKKRIFGLLIYIVTRVSLLQFSRILFRAFVRKLLITGTVWRMSLISTHMVFSSEIVTKKNFRQKFEVKIWVKFLLKFSFLRINMWRYYLGFINKISWWILESSLSKVSTPKRYRKKLKIFDTMVWKLVDVSEVHPSRIFYFTNGES